MSQFLSRLMNDAWKYEIIDVSLDKEIKGGPANATKIYLILHFYAKKTFLHF